MGTIRNISSSLNNKKCECKPLVTGPLCDRCQDGSFYLNELIPNGCIECYCSGVTKNCTAANNRFLNHISVNIDQLQHGLVLRDLSINPILINQDILFDNINKELIFQNFNQSISLYWQLPLNFLGNKIISYGGHLNYTFRFHGNYFQRHHRNPDALLIGNNITLVHYHNENLEPLISNKIAIRLIETEWKYEIGLFPVTRQDLMIVLSNLEAIFLLATATNDISSIGLISITLDTADEFYGELNESWQRVNTVELCDCPFGYTGTSCERCASGYKLSIINNNNIDYEKQFSCQPCFCNNHSNDCDSVTGICMVNN